MFPYFWPPPVPLTCVCEKPLTASGMGAQPALGNTPQSGPGFTIPKGMAGPGNVRPTPSLPMRGSTYFHSCACDVTLSTIKHATTKPFFITFSIILNNTNYHELDTNYS
jgi:hypothetical protein